MSLDKDTLKLWLAKAHGIAPAEDDLTALLSELAALESHFARWQWPELRDTEPHFLVREAAPGKGKRP